MCGKVFWGKKSRSLEFIYFNERKAQGERELKIKVPSTSYVWQGRDVSEVITTLTSIVLKLSMLLSWFKQAKIDFQFAALNWKEVSTIIFSTSIGENCLINILHLYGSATKRFLLKTRMKIRASSVSNKSCNCKSITIVASLQFNKTFWRLQSVKLQQFSFCYWGSLLH